VAHADWSKPRACPGLWARRDVLDDPDPAYLCFNSSKSYARRDSAFKSVECAADSIENKVVAAFSPKESLALSGCSFKANALYADFI